METPSELNQIDGVYLIDHLKEGNTWYLWTVANNEWAVVKTGDWETIIKKLGEIKLD